MAVSLVTDGRKLNQRVPLVVSAAPRVVLTGIANPPATLPSAVPSLVPKDDFNLLVDTSEFIPQVLDDIKNAKKAIAVSMFAWAPSGPGAEVASALEAKARQGVKVAVTLDGFGSRLFPMSQARKMVKKMQGAGIEVKTNWGLRLPWGIGKGAIDHRKIFVIDDSAAYIGGMNLSEKYYEWHDVMLRMTGQAAKAASDSFTETWGRLGGNENAINQSQPNLTIINAPAPAPDTRSLEQRRTASNLAKHNAVTVVENEPPTGELKASEEFFKQVADAKERIWVETPFLGSDKMVTALAQAAKRGVDVRILVPGPNKWKNGKVALHTTRTYYPELLASGARIFEQPEMSHAKVWMIDNRSTVGSVNIDSLSEKLIYEIAATTKSDDARYQVNQLFARDQARSREVDRADIKTATKVGASIRKTIGLQL